MQRHVWCCNCHHHAMCGVVGTVATPCGCCGCHCLAACDVMRAVILLCLVLQLLVLCCAWCWGCCHRAAQGIVGAVVVLHGTRAWWALEGEGGRVCWQEEPGCKRGS